MPSQFGGAAGAPQGIQTRDLVIPRMTRSSPVFAGLSFGSDCHQSTRWLACFLRPVRIRPGRSFSFSRGCGTLVMGLASFSEGQDMAGILCPKCGNPVSEIRNTIRSEGSVGRFRVCTCGRSVPTIEVPKAEYQTLVRLANGLGNGAGSGKN